jgi:hypothetical protein
MEVVSIEIFVDTGKTKWLVVGRLLWCVWQFGQVHQNREGAQSASFVCTSSVYRFI